ncbi:hypothetical protein D917_08340 [Trichinella nativa]|uniref:Uncharacterized protein n=1 Tax=Trichinella nativa TaxID=6335 RepID=A0A1Y3EP02_9BILA|nr:hypothetical protein D917_08340 [Trichinella nativa]
MTTETKPPLDSLFLVTIITKTSMSQLCFTTKKGAADVLWCIYCTMPKTPSTTTESAKNEET